MALHNITDVLEYMPIHERIKTCFNSTYHFVLICSIILLAPNHGYSWCLKTHLWIAQELFYDISDDGKVTINGIEYEIPADISNAIRSHPDSFYAGSLGPDIYPDAFVGQMVIHPGIQNYWQSDDWLRHLLKNAQTPEQIAFSYGYMTHYAGDIFGHTYINFYAGDIFDLQDKERTVEHRHITLEKYIEGATPKLSFSIQSVSNENQIIAPPYLFLRDMFIYSAESHRQYEHTIQAKHLWLMGKIRSEVKSLSDSMMIINKLVSKIKSTQLNARTDRLSYNLNRWLSDMDISTEEYIKASYRASIDMVSGSGNPLKEYEEWKSCYGNVFLAVPAVVDNTKCDIKLMFIEKIEETIDIYNDLIEKLPPGFQTLLTKYTNAWRKAKYKLKINLKAAAIEFSKIGLDNDLVPFIFTVTDNNIVVKRQDLNDAFSINTSNKKLLIFEHVSDLIDRDLNLSDTKLDPQRFSPIKHSVVLAKIGLLDSDEINRMIENFTFNQPPFLLGEEVYKQDCRNFSILINFARNLDGNDQWQAYGLPWPRSDGVCPHPKDLNFGYNYYENNTKGLKLYVNPFLRSTVFNVLFKPQFFPSIYGLKELQFPNYKYPKCKNNPYPSTQDIKGKILLEDLTCTK
ncbi:MAG: zinc dependent phospholipase C family protein [Pseudomonadota bacterium]